MIISLETKHMLNETDRRKYFVWSNYCWKWSTSILSERRLSLNASGTSTLHGSDIKQLLTLVKPALGMRWHVFWPLFPGFREKFTGQVYTITVTSYVSDKFACTSVSILSVVRWCVVKRHRIRWIIPDPSIHDYIRHLRVLINLLHYLSYFGHFKHIYSYQMSQHNMSHACLFVLQGT